MPSPVLSRVCSGNRECEMQVSRGSFLGTRKMSALLSRAGGVQEGKSPHSCFLPEKDLHEPEVENRQQFLRPENLQPLTDEIVC